MTDQTAEKDALDPITVTEYAALYPSGYVLEFPHPTLARSAAERRVANDGATAVVIRERTTYADTLTEWQPVTPPGVTSGQ